MENLSVNDVYGIALYEASVDLNLTSEFKKSLAEIGEVFSVYPQFRNLLNSPALSAEQRCEVVRKILLDKVPKELINFLCILIRKRRIGSLGGIVKSFNDIADRRDGIVKGRIISAVPLETEQLAKLEEQTGALLKMNVSLAPEVDTSLVGGVRIYVSGKLIDASIRKQLEDMKELLLS